MSTSTETNPFLNFKLASPDEEDTSTQALVPTQPTTPLADKSVVLDLTPDHSIAPIYSLVSTPSNLKPLFNVVALHSSPIMMKLWNRLLQSGLQEDNSGVQVGDYSMIQAISLFYMRFPTRPCAWFIAEPGCLGRVLPSDETKLRSGLALHLEDSIISTFLPVGEYPINFICLMEPIRRDKAYVIYKFASDLFSHFRTPQPEKAPTNLIAIPEYHAHEEAAHLVSQEATLHQRVLEEAYALPPLCTWENEWSPPFLETLQNLMWSEEWRKLRSLVSWRRKGRNI
ncbi:hypothetical protein PILCRDRAFT_10034 [Piloderma croceum F 1598]|uniref:Uncharacterized protein n=1 Tax=Piloderma croceum (strain F 1598) TaxID=765440 RepID=A0A0C3BRA2_PILCF|nr:hypothetical protein PILCRDRAFT_10034 [Piloderma croceum F 1598]